MLMKIVRRLRRLSKEMETRNKNQARTRTCIMQWMAALFLVGCGGGGGGGDDSGGNNNNPPPQGQEPVIAPAQLGGSVMRMSEPMDEEREVVFTPDGNWSNESSRGEASGTYVYEVQGPNSATVTLTSDQTTEVIALSFSSPHNGVYSYTAGPPISGGFTLEGAPQEPQEPTTPPGQPPKTGLAPSSLAGKTMLGTRTATSTGPKGQTHVYTFTSRTFHDSDPPEESDGNYTYTPNKDRAHLVLDYTSPRTFDGDHHDIQMTFISETKGTFTSVYTRKDGTVINIDGYFELQ